jgi:hypothetical protein
VAKLCLSAGRHAISASYRNVRALAFCPWLTLETRAVLFLTVALTALLVFICGQAAWQTADSSYVAGFVWSLSIVILSAGGKPAQSQMIQKGAFRSALRRRYIAWLDAQILRLRALMPDTRPLQSAEPDIENLRAWLVSAVPNVGGTDDGV